MWGTVLKCAVLIIIESFADSKSIRLLSKGNETIHHNGFTHHIAKYRILPGVLPLNSIQNITKNEIVEMLPNNDNNKDTDYSEIIKNGDVKADFNSTLSEITIQSESKTKSVESLESNEKYDNYAIDKNAVSTNKSNQMINTEEVMETTLLKDVSQDLPSGYRRSDSYELYPENYPSTAKGYRDDTRTSYEYLSDLGMFNKNNYAAYPQYLDFNGLDYTWEPDTNVRKNELTSDDYFYIDGQSDPSEKGSLNVVRKVLKFPARFAINGKSVDTRYKSINQAIDTNNMNAGSKTINPINLGFKTYETSALGGTEENANLYGTYTLPIGTLQYSIAGKHHPNPITANLSHKQTNTLDQQLGSKYSKFSGKNKYTIDENRLKYILSQLKEKSELSANGEKHVIKDNVLKNILSQTMKTKNERDMNLFNQVDTDKINLANILKNQYINDGIRENTKELAEPYKTDYFHYIMNDDSLKGKVLNSVYDSDTSPRNVQMNTINFNTPPEKNGNDIDDIVYNMAIKKSVEDKYNYYLSLLKEFLLKAVVQTKVDTVENVQRLYDYLLNVIAVLDSRGASEKSIALIIRGVYQEVKSIIIALQRFNPYNNIYRHNCLPCQQ